MRTDGARLGRTRRGLTAGAAFALAALVLVSGAALARPLGPLVPAAAATAPPFPTPIRHVVVVFLENEEASTVLANGSYERQLAQTWAYANEFFSPMHYSLPNYLAATSGYTSNQLKAVNQTNVGTLAAAANRTWKDYQESMPRPCDLTHQILVGGYDPAHNPFAFYEPFINQTAYCRAHMVAFSEWASDVAHNTVPNYALIVPNVTADGHNSGLAGAEAWLSHWLPPLLSAPFFQTTAMFITYDEGTSDDAVNGSTTGGGGHIYLALVSPYARMNFTSQTPYTTFSLLTTTEWLLGLGRTGTNDNWTVHPPMTDLFHFPVSFSGTVVTPKGIPVAGVLLTDRAGQTAVSNASGGFSFQLLAGNYTIYVPKRTGYVGRLSVSIGTTPVTGVRLVVHLAK